MSRQFRHRTVGAALVALFVAPVLLESGPAIAGGGFPCESRTVALAGVGLLPDGRSQEATGATEAAMQRDTVTTSPYPGCVLGDESSPVLVTASPSGPPVPTATGSTPTPSTTVSSGVTSTPKPTQSRTPTPSASVSAGGPPRRPPSSPDADRPTRVTRGPVAAGPSRTWHRPVPTVDAVPTRSPSRRTDPPRRWTAPMDRATTSSPAVAAATTGTPPGDADADRLSPDVSAVEIPAPTTTAPSPVVAAAEPIAEVKPLTRTGGVGLLALMAVVCVTGVMAGAVRAIAAERASRANLA